MIKPMISPLLHFPMLFATLFFMSGGLFLQADETVALEEPAAVLEGGDVLGLESGVKLFSNRNYVVGEVPEALSGFRFVLGKIEGISVLCRQAGMVYVATPALRRNPDSREAVLLKADFEKVDLPEFRFFVDAPAGLPDHNLCSVYRKRVEVGDSLDFGKWSILLLPRE